MSYKPDGHTSLAPFLIVRSVEETLSFLEIVFGAQRLQVKIGCDGSVRHAEAMVDDTVLMIGEMAEPVPAHVHIYVPDVDRAYARALEMGCIRVLAPTEPICGDRRSGVRDKDGITWWLVTQQRAA
ncbi:VOC family protein [Acuticoccus yangtzensis]|uniref:VOC family protein n=1 Tax=Acuticoccus yangtzensis TaxID=1443441 RepID=UPI00094975B3|nr:VOC family protein [Acuticoccus yangtzensis]ORE91180.1 Glyoxalase/bleomycin resistance protein/dioxygenase [Stappia sp. 22II-S9-Z10]